MYYFDGENISFDVSLVIYIKNTNNPPPLKMSTRDFSWGKDGRCVRLTTYHLRSAERQENPGS